MTRIRFTIDPGLSDEEIADAILSMGEGIEKHGDSHDETSHGNWANGHNRNEPGKETKVKGKVSKERAFLRDLQDEGWDKMWTKNGGMWTEGERSKMRDRLRARGVLDGYQIVDPWWIEELRLDQEESHGNRHGVLTGGGDTRGLGEHIMPFHENRVKGGVIKVQRNDGEWTRMRVREVVSPTHVPRLEVDYLEGHGPTVITYSDWHEIFDADTAIYEEADPGYKKSDTFSATVSIAKSYKNYVFGWANVSIRKDGTLIEDYQKHEIDPEDLEEAAYDFVLNSYGSGDMHISEGKGELIESVIFTKEKIEKMGLPPGVIPEGWWVGFKLDPEHAELVRSGKRSMFSIEGTARLDPA